VEWDITIWIEREQDFKESQNKLNELPGKKKLAIVLYHTADKRNPKDNAGAPLQYKNPNIFSFIGDSHGLHPKSEFQKEQEEKLLKYIFA